MRGWIGPIALALLTGIAAHWATLAAAPSVIMDQALLMLAKRNIALHAFTNPERITPQSQVVVRSSPDLFYALCRYDLSVPGTVLRVSVGEWEGYQSLSFFDASTNNFATLRGTGKSVEAHLHYPTEEVRAVSDFPDGWIQSPSERGVILIRRLAPTQELFDQALETAEADACEVRTP